LSKYEIWPDTVPCERRPTYNANRNRPQDYSVVGGIDFEPAPDKEPSDLNSAGLLIISKQQPGDEKAAEYKEEIDSCPSESIPESIQCQVTSDHKQYSDRPQRVQLLQSHLRGSIPKGISVVCIIFG
jgi:hypothetical protein